MKIVRRENIELNVEDTELEAMLRQGYEEIDPTTGKSVNPKKTELEKLTEENKALKKENKALKAQLEAAQAPAPAQPEK